MATVQDLLDNAQQRVEAMMSTFDVSDSQLSDFDELQDSLADILEESTSDAMNMLNTLDQALARSNEALDSFEEHSNNQLAEVRQHLTNLESELQALSDASDESLNLFSTESQTVQLEFAELHKLITEQLVAAKESVSAIGQEISKQILGASDATERFTDGVVEWASQLADGANGFDVACGTMVAEVSATTHSVAERVDSVCDGLHQELIELREHIAGCAEDCVATISENLVSQSTADFSGSCETLNSVFDDLNNTIDGCGEAFTDGVGKAMDKIENVVELIEDIKPVLDAVEDLV